jgi:hypothetical protein
MFRRLRKKNPANAASRAAANPDEFSLRRLLREADSAISIRAINNLPPGAQARVYRMLLPAELVARYDLNPITFRAASGGNCLVLGAQADSGVVNLAVKPSPVAEDPLLSIELADNASNGIDLNLLWLNDPDAPRFQTDVDEAGNATRFGTMSRNLPAEQAAMAAGLAPGQVRAGLRGSAVVFHNLDAFLSFAGQKAVFLEPLTYASAWLFERRGFAYVRGHKLMDDIQREFQPGGALHAALDGSTPFRQPGQGETVRGRAWAIHDGILSVLGERWDGLRMVRQVGGHAGVATFPNAAY